MSAPEPLELRPRSGVPVMAQAVVRRVAPALRTTRTALIAGGGLVLAVPAIVLPPHGLFSIGVVAVSGIAAYVAWTRGLAIARVDATCGKCGVAFTVAELGGWSDDQWVRCTACGEPYRVGKPAET